MTTIYCDAAPNTVKRVVNGYGRQVKFDNGGFRIGVIAEGKAEAVYYNTVCPDQFAGECYSVLTAIDFAKKLGLTTITIRNDRIGSFFATRKKGYVGTKYLYVARKLAEEAGIEVEFDPCSSATNKADRLSRSDRKQGIVML